MIEAYKKFWMNYANFKGRATRGDYWWVVLANMIVEMLLSCFGELGVTLSSAYAVITLVPTLALITRRLHDINKSGWSYLLILIPLVGWIIVLVFLCTDSVNENNKYNEKVEAVVTDEK